MPGQLQQLRQIEGRLEADRTGIRNVRPAPDARRRRAIARMPLPNFLIIGTRKAGTSSLYHGLVQHPDVFMPATKGARYFLHAPESDSGKSPAAVRTLEEYSQFFAGADATGARAIGEASPTYFEHEDAARRIRACVPEAKLIVTLRNPVDKVYSQYQMNLRRTGKKGPLPPTYELLTPLLSSCFYARHLRAYMKLFPKEQIKVLIFEHWIKSQEKTLDDLFEFLELPPAQVRFEDSRYNVGGVPRNFLYRSVLSARDRFIALKPLVPKRLRKVVNQTINVGMDKAPPLPPDVLRRLVEDFRSDILDLESLTGLDLAVWKNKY